MKSRSHLKPTRSAAQQAWERARQTLIDRLGPAAHQLGIESFRLATTDGQAVRLVAPNATLGTQLQAQHGDALAAALREAGLPDRVHIAPSVRPQGELFPEGTATQQRRAVRFGALIPRYTFATFVIGGSNQFAHAACQAVATQPGKHYNPLFLYGGVGLGKTHLANAVGHETLNRQPRARVAYFGAETFMTQLITALRRDRMDEFKATFRNIDVLIVDDVQFLANRERTQEEFFHTFNALHDAHRQIVLTSDKVPRDIPGLEERLRNRFEWGLIADIQPPDMETRVAILEKKADLEGVDLPRDVAIELASHIDSNVRELEGSLTRLSAFASVSKVPITLDLARQALHDLLRRQHSVTIDAVQNAVCEHYGVRLNDLLSKKRARKVTLPRQVGMYLARKLTRESYPSIGGRFGGRNHATVIHATRVIARKLKDDDGLRVALDELERILQAHTS